MPTIIISKNTLIALGRRLIWKNRRKNRNGRIEIQDSRKVQDLDLRNVSSRRRNPIIADIFNRLKYMDCRGSSFKKILDSYEFQEHYTEEMKPEFKSNKSEFWLIFKNLNYNAKNIGNDLSKENADKKMPTKNADKNGATIEEDTSILIRTIGMFLQGCLYSFECKRA